MENFKKENSLIKRKEQSAKIILKYEDRVPVIVSKLYNSNIPNLDKFKYLVPIDLTLGQFIYIIRKRLTKLSAEQALFLFVGNNHLLSPVSETMSNLYKNYKDPDGFLYIVYSSENTFG
jgi:GABA(A) receptor-associated protein